MRVSYLSLISHWYYAWKNWNNNEERYKDRINIISDYEKETGLSNEAPLNYEGQLLKAFSTDGYVH